MTPVIILFYYNIEDKRNKISSDFSIIILARKNKVFFNFPIHSFVLFHKKFPHPLNH